MGRIRVLRVIRFQHKAGLAAEGHRTCAPLFPACHFDIHAAIMAHPGTDKKPTVVFLARFFLEGPDGRLSLKGNGLQHKKTQNTEKTRKKVQNNFPDTPDYLQKRTDFGRWKLQAADYQALPAGASHDLMALRGFVPQGRIGAGPSRNDAAGPKRKDTARQAATKTA
jgi:hypothetical protein